jgi:hypothetical protein
MNKIQDKKQTKNTHLVDYLAKKNVKLELKKKKCDADEAAYMKG